MGVGESGYGAAGLQERVFDLINCGPRHRFLVRGGPGSPALMAHNCAQGLARDVFADMMLRVEAAGIPIIMHVHDECVVEVPENQADELLAKMLAIMHSPPDWIPDLPVAAEGTINDFYSK